jgi:hypothetical protein
LAADRKFQRSGLTLPFIQWIFADFPVDFHQHASMGARVIRLSGALQRKRRERRLLITIIASVVGSLLLAYVLVALDMRPDLSEMSVRGGVQDADRIVAWPDLGGSVDWRRSSGKAYLPDPATRSRVLGYMMDGERSVPDKAMVSGFILMPEAGQLLHPAHLEPFHMIEVSLERPFEFQFRKLVWVSGFLRRTKDRPQYGESAWRMRNAIVEPAPSKAIPEWFQP